MDLKSPLYDLKPMFLRRDSLETEVSLTVDSKKWQRSHIV